MSLLCLTMVYLTYYNWVEIYLENDLTWVDNITPWEESVEAFKLDAGLFDLVFKAVFSSSYYYSSPQVVMSILDELLVWRSSNDLQMFKLLNCLVSEVYELFSVTFFKLYYFYYTDYRNYIILFIHYNPELFNAFTLFHNTYFDAFTFNLNVSSVSDVFINNFDTVLLNYVGYFKWLVLTVIASIFFISTTRSSKLNSNLDFYFTRLFIYFYSYSRESRIQFEVTIQMFFFIILVWIFAIMSYNDSQVEFIEMLHLMIFYFFLFVISYLLYKYSIHYFAFLEASVIEGKSASFIGQQFVRDMSNTFALFLRFFLLLFRLNIYDGLDDFLDSYYIFFCDFNDDTYYDEMFLSLDGVMFFSPDNHNDSNLFNDYETDLLEDIFQKYYITWGKFFMFWAFILEEAFRVSLALYITYLIIFEVHSVNFSYSEDNYILNKRTN